MKWWNPFVWPIPVKLTLGLFVAVALAIAILMLVARSSFQSYSEQTVRAYLRERGDQQVEQINASLRTAVQNLNDFVDDRLNQRLVQDALAENRVGADGDPVLLQLRGFLGWAGRFQQVWLVNPAGQILFDYRRGGATSEPIYATIVQAAWEQSATAFELNAERVMSVVPLQFEGSTPVTLSAAYTADQGGDLLGFLIVLLDDEQVFFEYLRSSGSLFPTYSYLVAAGTSTGLLTPAEYLTEASRTVENSAVVPLAFRGQSDVAAYTLEGDESAVGYYAPIQNPYNPNNTIFAFVNEYNFATNVNPLGNLFDASRLFPLVVGLLVVFGLLAVLLNQVITPPIKNMTRAMQGMTQGDFTATVPSAGRGDEIGEMGAAFLDMRAQVRLLLDNLEARVAARSRDFAATQEISRFAATQRSLQTLLDQVVQLIVEQFSSIYHAQVFLLDEPAEYAVLRSSTGEAGKQLLARGHKLAAGSVSMIGQVVDMGQTLVARDAAASDIHRKNDLLPDTRAELAIPLRVGNRIIGALDVQSRQRDAFSQDEIQVLETMADQVAVAIENARLYQESVRRLEEIDTANRRSTHRAWQDYLNARRANQLTSEAGQSFSADLSGLRQHALERGQIITGEMTANKTVPLAVPILLRGQPIGTVEWEFPASDLDDNRLQLAQELANRLAVSLENARLFEERQRAAERERVVNTIAARLTPQTEISDILQTAVREIGQALRSPQVSIRLNEATAPSSNGTNGTHSDPQFVHPAMESSQP